MNSILDVCHTIDKERSLIWLRMDPEPEFDRITPFLDTKHASYLTLLLAHTLDKNLKHFQKRCSPSKKRCSFFTRIYDAWMELFSHKKPTYSTKRPGQIAKMVKTDHSRNAEKFYEFLCLQWWIKPCSNSIDSQFQQSFFLLFTLFQFKYGMVF